MCPNRVPRIALVSPESGVQWYNIGDNSWSMMAYMNSDALICVDSTLESFPGTTWSLGVARPLGATHRSS